MSDNPQTSKVRRLLQQLQEAVDPVCHAADSHAKEQEAFDTELDPEYDKVIVDRMKKTIFVVEATSTEFHWLWARHALEAEDFDSLPLRRSMKKIRDTTASGFALHEAEAALKEYEKERRQHRVDWKQVGDGFARQVGTIAGYPVMVTLFWAVLDGQMIMFYDSGSRVTDHTMVEEWLKKRCNPRYDGGTRRAHCDAMNFSHCLSAVREANAAKKEA